MTTRTGTFIEAVEACRANPGDVYISTPSGKQARWKYGALAWDIGARALQVTEQTLDATWTIHAPDEPEQKEEAVTEVDWNGMQERIEALEETVKRLRRTVDPGLDPPPPGMFEPVCTFCDEGTRYGETIGGVVYCEECARFCTVTLGSVEWAFASAVSGEWEVRHEKWRTGLYRDGQDLLLIDLLEAAYKTGWTRRRRSR